MEDQKEAVGFDIYSFLSECLDEISEEKSLVMENIKIIEGNIDGLTKEIDHIEKSCDPVFELFSPTKQTSAEKLEVLNADLDKLFVDLTSLNKKYEEISKKYENMKMVLARVQTDEGIQSYDYFSVSKENVSLDSINLTDEMGIKLLETQEAERKRIARDLHDSTVQNLTSIVHRTELCEKLIDIDTVRTKLELDSMIKTIRDTINGMREIIYNLRPMSIDDLGLVVTVQRYINQIMSSLDIEILLKVENEEIEVLPVVRLTLFRIIQEACNNAIKYSKSRKIDIILKYLTDKIELSVCDYGIGFETESLEKHNGKKDKSFGFSIMRERVYLLSGELDIISKPDMGTTIFVKVPISSYVEEKEKDDTNKNHNC